MQFLVELWIPILVSGGMCFTWATLAWVVLPFHRTEWKRLPSEHDVLEALRKSLPPPGLYAFPFARGSDLTRTDIRVALEKGPVGYVAIAKSGRGDMKVMLMQSIVFYVIVSTLVGYVAWNAGLKLGAPYLSVFRIVGSVTTMVYVLGSAPESIWFGRPWKSWAIQLADGVGFGVVTAATFAWLWPQ
jgi:hypothetical protein